MKKPLGLLAFLLTVALLLNGAIQAPSASQRSLAMAGLHDDGAERDPFFLDVELSSTRAFGPRILGAPSALMEHEHPVTVNLGALGGRGKLEIEWLGQIGKERHLRLRLHNDSSVVAEAMVTLQPDETFRLDPRRDRKELTQFRRLLCATTSAELALRAREI